MRICGDQGEVGNIDFLRYPEAAIPVKIEKLATDDGSQFTQGFTRKRTQLSGKQVFD